MLLLLSSLLVAQLPDIEKVELAKAPKDLCIELSAWPIASPPNKAEPKLTVANDGTATIYVEPNKAMSVRLTPAELQDLLKVIVNDNQFFDWDAAAINKEFESHRIAKIGGANAVVLKIRVRTARMEHTVEVQLGHSAELFNKRIPSLKRYVNTFVRLHELIAFTRAGGGEGIRRCLSAANAALKGEFPQAPPFTEKNFAAPWLVSASIDQRRPFVRFHRDDDLKAGHWTGITVVQSEDGSPVVQEFRRSLSPDNFNSWAQDGYKLPQVLELINREARIRGSGGKLEMSDLSFIHWWPTHFEVTFERAATADSAAIRGSFVRERDGKVQVYVGR